MVRIAPNSTRPQLVRDTNAPSRCVGSLSSYFGPPSGFAMHQTLIPMAAVNASHSRAEKDTLRDLETARPRNVSHAIHRKALCHHVIRRSTVSSGFLPCLAPVTGRGRRLPLLACHAKIVASLTAPDGSYSKLARVMG